MGYQQEKPDTLISSSRWASPLWAASGAKCDFTRCDFRVSAFRLTDAPFSKELDKLEFIFGTQRRIEAVLCHVDSFEFRGDVLPDLIRLARPSTMPTNAARIPRES